MDGSESGDIFPARQAITLIDQVDLSQPIKIPEVPPESDPDNLRADLRRELSDEVAQLKKKERLYPGP